MSTTATITATAFLPHHADKVESARDALTRFTSEVTSLPVIVERVTYTVTSGTVTLSARVVCASEREAQDLLARGMRATGLPHDSERVTAA